MASSKLAIRAMAVGVSLLMIVGCASKPPEDVTIKGSLQAVDNVNPDTEGRPSPLVVRIYQLKAKDKFEQGDFFPLFDDAEATLGGDLLGVEDVMLAPGEFRSFEGEFDPTTRFVGVVAAYRDIHQAEWKAIVEMPEKSLLKFLKRGALTIKAESLAVTVSTGE